MRSEVRRLTRELVSAVLGEREDAALLRPVLTTMLTVAIADFERYHDSRHASNRIRDTEILLAWRKAQKQKKGADGARRGE